MDSAVKIKIAVELGLDEATLEQDLQAFQEKLRQYKLTIPVGIEDAPGMSAADSIPSTPRQTTTSAIAPINFDSLETALREVGANLEKAIKDLCDCKESATSPTLPQLPSGGNATSPSQTPQNRSSDDRDLLESLNETAQDVGDTNTRTERLVRTIGRTSQGILSGIFEGNQQGQELVKEAQDKSPRQVGLLDESIDALTSPIVKAIASNPLARVLEGFLLNTGARANNASLDRLVLPNINKDIKDFILNSFPTDKERAKFERELKKIEEARTKIQKDLGLISEDQTKGKRKEQKPSRPDNFVTSTVKGFFTEINKSFDRAIKSEVKNTQKSIANNLARSVARPLQPLKDIRDTVVERVNEEVTNLVDNTLGKLVDAIDLKGIRDEIDRGVSRSRPTQQVEPRGLAPGASSDPVSFEVASPREPDMAGESGQIIDVRIVDVANNAVMSQELPQPTNNSPSPSSNVNASQEAPNKRVDRTQTLPTRPPLPIPGSSRVAAQPIRNNAEPLEQSALIRNYKKILDLALSQSKLADGRTLKDVGITASQALPKITQKRGDGAAYNPNNNTLAIGEYQAGRLSNNALSAADLSNLIAETRKAIQTGLGSLIIDGSTIDVSEVGEVIANAIASATEGVGAPIKNVGRVKLDSGVSLPKADQKNISQKVDRISSAYTLGNSFVKQVAAALPSGAKDKVTSKDIVSALEAIEKDIQAFSRDLLLNVVRKDNKKIAQSPEYDAVRDLLADKDMGIGGLRAQEKQAKQQSDNGGFASIYDPVDTGFASIELVFKQELELLRRDLQSALETKGLQGSVNSRLFAQLAKNLNPLLAKTLSQTGTTAIKNALTNSDAIAQRFTGVGTPALNPVLSRNEVNKDDLSQGVQEEFFRRILLAQGNIKLKEGQVLDDNFNPYRESAGMGLFRVLKNDFGLSNDRTFAIGDNRVSPQKAGMLAIVQAAFGSDFSKRLINKLFSQTAINQTFDSISNSAQEAFLNLGNLKGFRGKDRTSVGGVAAGVTSTVLLDSVISSLQKLIKSNLANPDLVKLGSGFLKVTKDIAEGAVGIAEFTNANTTVAQFATVLLTIIDIINTFGKAITKGEINFKNLFGSLDKIIAKAFLDKPMLASAMGKLVDEIGTAFKLPPGLKLLLSGGVSRATSRYTQRAAERFPELARFEQPDQYAEGLPGRARGLKNTFQELFTRPKATISRVGTTMDFSKEFFRRFGESFKDIRATQKEAGVGSLGGAIKGAFSEASAGYKYATSEAQLRSTPKLASISAPQSGGGLGSTIIIASILSTIAIYAKKYLAPIVPGLLTAIGTKIGAKVFTDRGKDIGSSFKGFGLLFGAITKLTTSIFSVIKSFTLLTAGITALLSLPAIIKNIKSVSSETFGNAQEKINNFKESYQNAKPIDVRGVANRQVQAFTSTTVGAKVAEKVTKAKDKAEYHLAPEINEIKTKKIPKAVEQIEQLKFRAKYAFLPEIDSFKNSKSAQVDQVKGRVEETTAKLKQTFDQFIEEFNQANANLKEQKISAPTTETFASVPEGSTPTSTIDEQSSALGKIILGLGTAIAFGKNLFIKGIKALSDFITRQIRLLAATKVGQNIAQKTQDIKDNIGAKVSPTVEEFKNNQGAKIVEVVEKIGDIASDIKTSVQDATSELQQSETAQKVKQEAEVVKEKTGEFLEQTSQKVAQSPKTKAMITQAQNISQTAKNVGGVVIASPLGQAIQNKAKGIKNRADQVDIPTTLANVKRFSSQGIGDLRQSATKGVQSFKNTPSFEQAGRVANNLTKTVTEIRQGFSKQLEDVKTKIKLLQLETESATTNIVKEAKEIKQNIQQQLANVKANLGTAGLEAENLTVELVNGFFNLVTIIKDKIATAAMQFQGITLEVQDLGTKTSIAGMDAQEKVATFTNNVGQRTQGIRSNIKNAAEQIKDNFAGNNSQGFASFASRNARFNTAPGLKVSSKDFVNPQELSKNFSKIFDLVISQSKSITGQSLKELNTQIKNAEIKILSKGDAAEAVYDPTNNAISLKETTAIALANAKLAAKDLENLIHEVRHAVQMGSGINAKNNLQNAPRLPGELTSISRAMQSAILSASKGMGVKAANGQQIKLNSLSNNLSEADREKLTKRVQLSVDYFMKNQPTVDELTKLFPDLPKESAIEEIRKAVTNLETDAYSFAKEQINLLGQDSTEQNIDYEIKQARRLIDGQGINDENPVDDQLSNISVRIKSVVSFIQTGIVKILNLINGIFQKITNTFGGLFGKIFNTKLEKSSNNTTWSAPDPWLDDEINKAPGLASFKSSEQNPFNTSTPKKDNNRAVVTTGRRVIPTINTPPDLPPLPSSFGQSKKKVDTTNSAIVPYRPNPLPVLADPRRARRNLPPLQTISNQDRSQQGKATNGINLNSVPFPAIPIPTKQKNNRQSQLVNFAYIRTRKQAEKSTTVNPDVINNPLPATPNLEQSQKKDSPTSSAIVVYNRPLPAIPKPPKDKEITPYAIPVDPGSTKVMSSAIVPYRPNPLPVLSDPRRKSQNLPPLQTILNQGRSQQGKPTNGINLNNVPLPATPIPAKSKQLSQTAGISFIQSKEQVEKTETKKREANTVGDNLDSNLVGSVRDSLIDFYSELDNIAKISKNQNKKKVALNLQDELDPLIKKLSPQNLPKLKEADVIKAIKKFNELILIAKNQQYRGGINANAIPLELLEQKKKERDLAKEKENKQNVISTVTDGLDNLLLNLQARYQQEDQLGQIASEQVQQEIKNLLNEISSTDLNSLDNSKINEYIDRFNKTIETVKDYELAPELSLTELPFLNIKPQPQQQQKEQTIKSQQEGDLVFRLIKTVINTVSKAALGLIVILKTAGMGLFKTIKNFFSGLNTQQINPETTSQPGARFASFNEEKQKNSQSNFVAINQSQNKAPKIVQPPLPPLPPDFGQTPQKRANKQSRLQNPFNTSTPKKDNNRAVVTTGRRVIPTINTPPDLPPLPSSFGQSKKKVDTTSSAIVPYRPNPLPVLADPRSARRNLPPLQTISNQDRSQQGKATNGINLNSVPFPAIPIPTKQKNNRQSQLVNFAYIRTRKQAEKSTTVNPDVINNPLPVTPNLEQSQKKDSPTSSAIVVYNRPLPAIPKPPKDKEITPYAIPVDPGSTKVMSSAIVPYRPNPLPVLSDPRRKSQNLPPLQTILNQGRSQQGKPTNGINLNNVPLPATPIPAKPKKESQPVGIAFVRTPEQAEGAKVANRNVISTVKESIDGLSEELGQIIRGTRDPNRVNQAKELQKQLTALAGGLGSKTTQSGLNKAIENFNRLLSQAQQQKFRSPILSQALEPIPLGQTAKTITPNAGEVTRNLLTVLRSATENLALEIDLSVDPDNLTEIEKTIQEELQSLSVELDSLDPSLMGSENINQLIAKYNSLVDASKLNLDNGDDITSDRLDMLQSSYQASTPQTADTEQTAQAVEEIADDFFSQIKRGLKKLFDFVMSQAKLLLNWVQKIFGFKPSETQNKNSTNASDEAINKVSSAFRDLAQEIEVAANFDGADTDKAQELLKELTQTLDQLDNGDSADLDQNTLNRMIEQYNRILGEAQNKAFGVPVQGDRLDIFGAESDPQQTENNRSRNGAFASMGGASQPKWMTSLFTGAGVVTAVIGLFKIVEGFIKKYVPKILEFFGIKLNKEQQTIVDKISEASNTLVDRAYKIFDKMGQQMGITDPNERNQVGAEAAGLGASVMAMTNPGLLMSGLIAPIAGAFAPITASLFVFKQGFDNLIAPLIQSLKELEPVRIALNTVAGSKQGGAQMFDYAQEFASKTGVGIMPALQGYKGLTAAALGTGGTTPTGMSLEEVNSLYEGISKSAISLGLDQESTNLVFLAFQQISSKGKLSLEELRGQLSERMPGAIQLFAKSLGVSQQQLLLMIQRGQILSNNILPKVAAQLNKDFASGAESSAMSFTGGLTKIGNALIRVKLAILTQLGPALAFLTQFFGNTVNFIADTTERIGQTISSVAIGLSATVLAGFSFVADKAGITKMMSAAFTPIFANVFSRLTPFISGLFVDSIGQVFSSLTGMKTMTFIDIFRKPITNLVYMVIYAIKYFENLQTSASNFGKTLQTIGTQMGRFAEYISLSIGTIGTIITLFGAATGTVAPWLLVFGKLAMILGGAIGTVLVLGKAYQGVSKNLDTGVQALQMLLTIFKNLVNVALIYIATSQTMILFQLLFNKGVFNGVIALKTQAKAFLESANKAKIFTASLNTMAAGLSGLKLTGMMGFALVLDSLINADFANDWLIGIGKIGDEANRLGDAVDNILRDRKMRVEMQLSQKEKVKDPTAPMSIGDIKDFGSKGFKLDFLGIVEAAVGKPIYTDDLIKAYDQADKSFVAKEFDSYIDSSLDGLVKGGILNQKDLTNINQQLPLDPRAKADTFIKDGGVLEQIEGIIQKKKESNTLSQQEIALAESYVKQLKNVSNSYKFQMANRPSTVAEMQANENIIQLTNTRQKIDENASVLGLDTMLREGKLAPGEKTEQYFELKEYGTDRTLARINRRTIIGQEIERLNTDYRGLQDLMDQRAELKTKLREADTNNDIDQQEKIVKQIADKDIDITQKQKEMREKAPNVQIIYTSLMANKQLLEEEIAKLEKEAADPNSQTPKDLIQYKLQENKALLNQSVLPRLDKLNKAGVELFIGIADMAAKISIEMEKLKKRIESRLSFATRNLLKTQANIAEVNGGSRSQFETGVALPGLNISPTSNSQANIDLANTKAEKQKLEQDLLATQELAKEQRRLTQLLMGNPQGEQDPDAIPNAIKATQEAEEQAYNTRIQLAQKTIELKQRELAIVTDLARKQLELADISRSQRDLKIQSDYNTRLNNIVKETAINQIPEINLNQGLRGKGQIQTRLMQLKSELDKLNQDVEIRIKVQQDRQDRAVKDFQQKNNTKDIPDFSKPENLDKIDQVIREELVKSMSETNQALIARKAKEIEISEAKIAEVNRFFDNAASSYSKVVDVISRKTENVTNSFKFFQQQLSNVRDYLSKVGDFFKSKFDLRASETSLDKTILSKLIEAQKTLSNPDATPEERDAAQKAFRGIQQSGEAPLAKYGAFPGGFLEKLQDQKLNEEINNRINSLLQEQVIATQLYELERKREESVAKMAKLEAEMAKSKAQQAVGEAKINLVRANIEAAQTGDYTKVALAELELAAAQTANLGADQQIAIADSNIALQQEISRLGREQLKNNQKAQRNQEKEKIINETPQKGILARRLDGRANRNSIPGASLANQIMDQSAVSLDQANLQQEALRQQRDLMLNSIEQFVAKYYGKSIDEIATSEEFRRDSAVLGTQLGKPALAGETTQSAQEPASGTIEVQNADGSTTSYVYTPEGFQDSKNLQQNNTASQVNDSTEQGVTFDVPNADGSVTRYTYSDQGFIPDNITSSDLNLGSPQLNTQDLSNVFTSSAITVSGQAIYLEGTVNHQSQQSPNSSNNRSAPQLNNQATPQKTTTSSNSQTNPQPISDKQASQQNAPGAKQIAWMSAPTSNTFTHNSVAQPTSEWSQRMIALTSNQVATQSASAAPTKEEGNIVAKIFKGAMGLIFGDQAAVASEAPPSGQPPVSNNTPVVMQASDFSKAKNLDLNNKNYTGFGGGASGGGGAGANWQEDFKLTPMSDPSEKTKSLLNRKKANKNQYRPEDFKLTPMSDPSERARKAIEEKQASNRTDSFEGLSFEAVISTDWEGLSNKLIGAGIDKVGDQYSKPQKNNSSGCVQLCDPICCGDKTKAPVSLAPINELGSALGTIANNQIATNKTNTVPQTFGSEDFAFSKTPELADPVFGLPIGSKTNTEYKNHQDYQSDKPYQYQLDQQNKLPLNVGYAPPAYIPAYDRDQPVIIPSNTPNQNVASAANPNNINVTINNSFDRNNGEQALLDKVQRAQADALINLFNKANNFGNFA